MKKNKVIAATLILTLALPSLSFAQDSTKDDFHPLVEKSRNLNLSDLPDYYFEAEGKINPENANLENLPPSKTTISLNLGQDSGGIGTRASKVIAGGEGQTYLNRDGLKWYGTNATSVTKAVVAFSVTGTLYRQNKGSTKTTVLDADYEGEEFSSGLVMVQPQANSSVAGATYISEGVHYVNLGLVSDTKVTTVKKPADAPY